MIGKDVRIHELTQLPEDIIIGNHVAIDMGVYISTHTMIGDYVHIAQHVCVIGGKHGQFIMRDFSNIGAGSKIVVVSDDFTTGMVNPIVPIEYRNLIGKITVMDRFTVIGVNSVVMPNVNMHEGSVLGANSLLMEDAEPWTIYVGSPARPIKKRSKDWILKSYKQLGYDL